VDKARGGSRSLVRGGSCNGRRWGPFHRRQDCQRRRKATRTTTQVAQRSTEKKTTQKVPLRTVPCTYLQRKSAGGGGVPTPSQACPRVDTSFREIPRQPLAHSSESGANLPYTEHIYTTRYPWAAQQFKFCAKEPIQDISGSRGQNRLYGLWVRSCPASFQITQVPMTNDLWWTGSCQFVGSAIRGRLG